jgi:hypothetical protein
MIHNDENDVNDPDDENDENDENSLNTNCFQCSIDLPAFPFVAEIVSLK